MITDRTQRWRERRTRFIPAATEIDPRCYAVDVVEARGHAAPFVAEHNYAATMPVARLSLGLFRNAGGGRSELAGVCVFSVPINHASVPKSTGLADSKAACDLGRFVLLDDVPGNGESYFLVRALRFLRQEKPGILSVISYADPIRRIDGEGRVFLPGHVGALYAVMGSRYVGRSSPRRDLLLPDGNPLSSRGVSKIRSGETGMAYAIDQVVRAGAPAPRPEKPPGAWLDDLIGGGFFGRRRHPGNHIYVFPLTKAARLAASRVPALPYPALDRGCAAGDVTALPLLARAA